MTSYRNADGSSTPPPGFQDPMATPVTPPVKTQKSLRFGQGSFVPQPATQQFTPGNNLIGTQFNPTPSARGVNAAGMTDKSATAVNNYQFNPFQQQSANTSQSQGIYDQLLKSAQGGGMFGGAGGGGAASFDVNGKLQPLLDKVINAPDRGQLAQDMYGVLEERANPGFEQRLRSVGQKAAALGRVGAGLTTSELGDVETTHNRDLDLSRRQLAAEGAGASLDDRLKQLGAARDVYGAVSAAGTGYNNSLTAGNQANFNNLLTLGRDIYGRESDSFGRNVGERDAGLNYDQTRFGNERSKLQDASIYEGDIYGQDRNNRDEYRGERDYQYGLERDAQGDRERQYGMQEDAKQNDWNRAYQAAQFGYGTNPAGAVNSAAGQKNQGAQSYMDTLGPLFLEWAKKRQGGGVATPASGGYGTSPMTE